MSHRDPDAYYEKTGDVWFQPDDERPWQEQDAIRHAINVERERCAKIVMDELNVGSLNHIVEAIRNPNN